jgi:hypothetical protein
MSYRDGPLTFSADGTPAPLDVPSDRPLAGPTRLDAEPDAAALVTAFDAEQWLAIHRERDLTASALEFRILCHATCLATMLRQ